MMVSWSYLIKALKSNIWLYSLLFLHMGPCIVLFCFLWQAWQSKRLFSSCPHTPVCLNINLSHRIWFLPAQPVHSSEASTVKRLKVSQILCDVWDPVDHRANGRERTTIWMFPTWDSVTWCAVQTEMIRGWDWKPVWLPVLLLCSWTQCYKTEEKLPSVANAL